MPNSSGPGVNLLKKEKTMFTFEAVTAQYAKYAKQAIGYVQDETMKKDLEKLTDAQVEYLNGLYTSTTELAKTAFDAVKTNYGKHSWAK
jgi:hypothetical protein